MLSRLSNCFFHSFYSKHALFRIIIFLKKYREEKYLIDTLWIDDFRNYLRFLVTTFLIRGSARGVV